jgi:hypothetical protein
LRDRRCACARLTSAGNVRRVESTSRPATAVYLSDRRCACARLTRRATPAELAVTEVGHCRAIKQKAHRDWVGLLLYGCLTMTYFRTGAPYYHRRAAVSRSCSGWEGVGPAGCGRQALKVGRQVFGSSCGALENRKHIIDCRFPIADRLPIRTHDYGVKPHGQLVPVCSTRCRASTPGLSTWWSATTLEGDQVPGRSHLQARFPLRCFQRLSLPYIATRRCDWRHNRYTSGTSTPVLSY